MTTSAAGVSVSWLLFWLIFLAINLRLVQQADKAQTSRVMRQTVWSYRLSVAMVLSFLTVMYWEGTGRWNERDTLTTVLASTGIITTLGVARLRGLTYTDPIVKGILSIFFKALPQLMLAYNMWVMHEGKLTWEMVLVGHMTISLRLIQLAFAVKEASTERNRRGSAISEIANCLSWIVATIAWFKYC